MLVLTRKQNEKIQIGDSITITVVRTKGKTVRLGIDAPANLSVLRGELVFDLADEPPAETPAEEEAGTAARPAGAQRANRNPKWTAGANQSPARPAAAASPSVTSAPPLRSLMPTHA